MLHNFLRPGPWFAAKRYGYGAGLPIARQGWVLLGLWAGAMAGIAALARTPSAMPRLGVIVLLLVVTGIFLAVVYRRTQGGWKWRWGSE